MEKKNLVEQLKKISVSQDSGAETSGVDLDVIVPKDNLLKFAELLLNESFLLNYVTAVHTEPEMTIVYQFVNTTSKVRIRGRVFAGENKIIPSICNIFNGAVWYEREVMEFFGLDFDGNEDKRTLILPEEDKGLYPLLKKEGKVKSTEDTGLC